MSVPLLYDLMDAYPWVFVGAFVLFMIAYNIKGDQ